MTAKKQPPKKKPAPAKVPAKKPIILAYCEETDTNVLVCDTDMATFKVDVEAEAVAFPGSVWQIGTFVPAEELCTVWKKV